MQIKREKLMERHGECGAEKAEAALKRMEQAAVMYGMACFIGGAEHAKIFEIDLAKAVQAVLEIDGKLPGDIVQGMAKSKGVKKNVKPDH